MSILFEKTGINGVELPNRFVRSATWEGMATEEGAVTERLKQVMISLARGGAGLIISGHSYVSRQGQAGPWQLGIYRDELVGGLREMTDAVHEMGGRIFMQLAHAGLFAAIRLSGKIPLFVSDLKGFEESPKKLITGTDIKGLVSAFAEAAGRAKAAGFDGVQIHSGHGYLLSQFLSPIYNRRRDEYGGDIENRVRIHLEILRALRKEVGEKFPVMIKINCGDFAENGLSMDDSLKAALMLEKEGLDGVELTGGLVTGGNLSPSRPGINSEEKEAYFKEEAAAFKKELGIPLILVGGIRSFNVAEHLVQEEGADYISMSRPFIREPDLINRWRSGDLRKALCNSDNLCLSAGFRGDGVYCVSKERERT